MRKILKYTLLTILSLFFVVSLFFGWLVATESGLQWLITQAQFILAEQLHVKQVKGRLIDHFSIEELRYQQTEINLELTEFNFIWNINALWDFNLHIEQCEAKKVHITLNTNSTSSPPEPSTSEIPDIHLPVALQIDHFAVKDLQIIPAPSAKPIIIENLELKASGQDQINLMQLALQTPEATLKTTGTISLNKPYSVDLKILWTANLPTVHTALTNLRGEVAIQGDTNKLTIQPFIQSPREIRLNIELTNLLTKLEYKANLNFTELPLPEPQAVTSDMVLRNTILQATGNLEKHEFQLDTAVSSKKIPEIIELKTKFQGEFSDQQLKINTLHLQPLLTLCEFCPKNPELNLTGIILLKETLPIFDIKAVWSDIQWGLNAQKPVIQSPRGEIILTGSPNNYHSIIKTAVTGENIPLSQWVADIQGNLQEITIQNLEGDILQGKVLLKGDIGWQPTIRAGLILTTNNIALQTYTSELPENARLNTHTELHFIDNVLTLPTFNAKLSETNINLDLEGNIKLTEIPEFTALLKWKGLKYPLNKTSIIAASPQGQFSIQGNATNYEMLLKTALEGEQIPSSQWELNAQGNTQHLQLQRLYGNLLGGTLDLKGNIYIPIAENVTPDLPKSIVQWQTLIEAKNINLGTKWQDLPSDLNGKIETNGQLDSKNLNAEINIDSIIGKLRNYPLQISGKLAAKNQYYQIQNFDFRTGKNQFTASATLDNNLNGEWILKAPELKSFLPTLSGSLQGSGKLGGTLTEPRIEANLEGKTISFQDLQLNSLKIQTKGDIHPNKPIEFKANFTQLLQDKNLLLAELNIDGKGNLNNHTINLEIKRTTEQLKLTLQGKLDTLKTAWQGQLQKFQVDIKNMGLWQISTPTKINASSQQVNIEKICLNPAKKEIGNICVGGEWDNQKDSRIQLNLNKLSLSLLQPFLPTGNQITGALVGDIVIIANKNGKLRAETDIQINEGIIATVIEEEIRRFKHRGGRIIVQLNEQGLNARLNLQALDNSGLQGTLRMPTFTQLPLHPDHTLDSQINLNFSDLALLQSFIPGVDKLQGAIVGNLGVIGTVGAPRVNGQVNLNKISLELPAIGLQLQDINATVKAENATKLQLQAKAISGRGKVNLTGEVLLPSLTDWRINMQLKGEQFQVINSPDVQAEASPDLDIRLRPDAVNVTGKLFIPKAIITPNLVIGETEGNIVGLSSDIDIIEIETQKIPTKTNAMAIAANVQVQLGNEISLEIIDFKSYIGGVLQLIKRPQDELPIANGELQIVKGTYRAYGQDLEIERGRIIFTNSAITDPDLNIDAIRRIRRDRSANRVEAAGVRIRGSAQSPQVTLFSTPMLEEAQILSYLLTGAALDLPDEARQLSLGMYILPSLYISVGVSLFDRKTEFILHYELSEKWGVETVLGEQDKGVEFTYTLGR